MTLNSINTNSNAYVALQSLNETSASLSATQKAISTGFRVAGASDDGASFSIAQKVRSDVSGLTTVTQQLGNVQGLVGVATTALTTVSTAFASVKSLLTEIANASTSSDQRTQDVTSYTQLVSTIADAIDGAVYNGQTLLGTNTGNTTAPTAGFAVVTDENGTMSTIASQDMVGGTDNASGTANSVAATLATFIGTTFTRTETNGVLTDTMAAPTDAAAQAAAQTALATATGATSFDSLQLAVNTSLNALGSDTNFINSTITFTNEKIDSLNTGMGSLIDANLTQESAMLQSLQIKQQLGTQALSIANQSPQSLLSLFR
jgi:flagellin